jgi:hypothetical protein
MRAQGVLTGLAATGLLIAGISASQAQTIEDQMAGSDRGLYFSGAAGLHQTRDSDISGGAINSSADFDRGLAGLVGLGFDFGANWRLEAEAGYRDADIDSIPGA